MLSYVLALTEGLSYQQHVKLCFVMFCTVKACLHWDLLRNIFPSKMFLAVKKCGWRIRTISVCFCLLLHGSNSICCNLTLHTVTSDCMIVFCFLTVMFSCVYAFIFLLVTPQLYHIWDICHF